MSQNILFLATDDKVEMIHRIVDAAIMKRAQALGIRVVGCAGGVDGKRVQ